MRNVSDKSCRGNQNTHSMFSNFSSENCAFYEIMPTDVVQPDRTQIKHNTTHALCMLGNWSYRHTLRICNN